MSISLMYIPM